MGSPVTHSCRSCRATTVERLLEFGPQPICNRFLKSRAEGEYTHPIALGVCVSCGLVQLTEGPPAAALRPPYEWITYREPEAHLDELAGIIRSLPGISSDSVAAGVSFKDDSTLERLRRLGLARTWRISLDADLHVSYPGAGVETVQEMLTPAAAAAAAGRNGPADILLARHILEHAYDPGAFMSSLARMVKPGGYIVFEAPDCARLLELFDYSMVWEEHTLYLTSSTFLSALRTGGFAVIRSLVYAYSMENSLVAVVRYTGDAGSEERASGSSVVAADVARARRFADEFAGRRERFQALCQRVRGEGGKVALFGAGHLACVFLNLIAAPGGVEFVADDNPNKQGLCMPGSRVPIRGSRALLEEGIALCLFALGPEVEPVVIKKNKAFVEAGGRFGSILPGSARSLQI